MRKGVERGRTLLFTPRLQKAKETHPGLLDARWNNINHARVLIRDRNILRLQACLIICIQTKAIDVTQVLSALPIGPKRAVESARQNFGLANPEPCDTNSPQFSTISTT